MYSHLIKEHKSTKCGVPRPQIPSPKGEGDNEAGPRPDSNGDLGEIWERTKSKASTMNKIDTFDGDFEYLHIAASFAYGPVPSHPTAGDVHLAVSSFEHDRTPAAVWNLEAIKWRRANPGTKMDLGAITKAVAKRLHKEVTA